VPLAEGERDKQLERKMEKDEGDERGNLSMSVQRPLPPK
jgi:hypothetical protein